MKSSEKRWRPPASGAFATRDESTPSAALPPADSQADLNAWDLLALARIAVADDRFAEAQALLPVIRMLRPRDRR